jgi:hypothetical protein
LEFFPFRAGRSSGNAHRLDFCGDVDQCRESDVVPRPSRSRGRSGSAISQVFFVASVILAPDLPGRTRPVEVLIIGIVSWVTQVTGQLRYLKVRAGHPWSWLIWRAGLAQLATIPFCTAGVLLLAGSPYALEWLMPGFLFSFVAGLLSAWVLLVEIRR